MSNDQQPQEQPPEEPKAEGPAQLQHEAWAEAKGMLPQFAADRAGPLGVQRANPHYWKYAAARAHKGWTDGQLVTEAEFDAAADEASNQISR